MKSACFSDKREGISQKQKLKPSPFEVRVLILLVANRGDRSLFFGLTGAENYYAVLSLHLFYVYSIY